MARRWRLLAGLCVALAAHPAGAWADVVVLKSGGELRGELQRSAPGRPTAKSLPRAADDSQETLTIRTVFGAQVTVQRDEVESVIRRRAVLEEHETLSRAAADTVEAQWLLAEWCRDRSLSKQRAAHLQRVVELEPGHEAAHRGLGHIRYEGRWTTQEQMMTQRGYVKYKGRFVLPQELELIEAEERESEAEKAWHKRVHLWRLWLESDRVDRQVEGLNQLKAIRDADAVTALARTFKNDPNDSLRLLFVDILSKIRGDKPVPPLVLQSLHDESQQVRTASIRGVRAVNAAAGIPIYLRALKNEQNLIVNRAASALGQLEDEAVVPLLVEALVTRHRYKVWVPAQNTSMGTDGSMASGTAPLPPDVAAMLATGQLPGGVQVVSPGPHPRMKQITIQKDEQNPAVLSALSNLTGENLGYDEQAWRGWIRAKSAGTVKPKKKPASAK